MILLFAVLLGIMRSSSAVGTGYYFPEYLPADVLLEACDHPYISFKQKCVKIVQQMHPAGTDFAMLSCLTNRVYPDVFESEEERTFVFNELLGGIEVNVYGPIVTNSSHTLHWSSFLFGLSITDTTYFESKIVQRAPSAFGTYYDCTITEDDMECQAEESAPEAATGQHYIYCTYARASYDEPMHPCDITINHKLRKDATRTLRFSNNKVDICYISIKNRRIFKSAMAKIYGYSSSCPTGFLVSSNVNKEIRGDTIPEELVCGDGSGFGNVLLKKRSRRGEELRLYIVLNGDGTPMRIRVKGRAF